MFWFWSLLLLLLLSGFRNEIVNGECLDTKSSWLEFANDEGKSKSAVNFVTGSQLQKYLKETSDVEEDEKAALIKLYVINGTLWLDRGGSLSDFTIVLGKLPETSSDLSLIQALKDIDDSSSNYGIMIQSEESNLIPNVIEIIENNNNNKNVIIQIPIEEENKIDRSDKLFDVGLYWKEKKFGIDPILDRVRGENLLLSHDYQRIKSVVDFIYNSDEETDVPPSDLIYLRRKNRDIERKDKTSFTHLYLLSVLKLAEKLRKLREKDLVQLMPDLQATNVEYSEKDMKNLRNILKKLNSTKNIQKCAGNDVIVIQIRAGILSSSKSSTEAIKKLLSDNPNVVVLISSMPFDNVDVQKLSDSLSDLGYYYKDRLIYDLPSKLTYKLRKLNQVIVPKTDFDSSSSSSVKLSSFTGIIFSIFIIIMNKLEL